MAARLRICPRPPAECSMVRKANPGRVRRVRGCASRSRHGLEKPNRALRDLGASRHFCATYCPLNQAKGPRSRRLRRRGDEVLSSGRRSRRPPSGQLKVSLPAASRRRPGRRDRAGRRLSSGGLSLPSAPL